MTARPARGRHSSRVAEVRDAAWAAYHAGSHPPLLALAAALGLPRQTVSGVAARLARHGLWPPWEGPPEARRVPPAQRGAAADPTPGEIAERCAAELARRAVEGRAGDGPIVEMRPHRVARTRR